MMAGAVSKTRIQNSIEAVRACNLPIAAITILRNGSVRISTVDAPIADQQPAKPEEQPEPWT